MNKILLICINRGNLIDAHIGTLTRMLETLFWVATFVTATVNLISPWLPWNGWLAQFFCNAQEKLTIICVSAFVIATTNRELSRVPHFGDNSYMNMSQSIVNQIKSIEIQIEEKTQESLENWEAFLEAERRIDYASDLVKLDRSANRSLSDRVCLTGFINDEKLIKTECYDAVCILVVKLEELDTRKFRLLRNLNMGPVTINSNRNGSLQLHRQSQVQAIRLNFQTDRSVPIERVGNQLIAPDSDKKDSLPPWQNLPVKF